MKSYIEVSSPKGGVGVSTTACAIAVGLAKEGNKVLLVDMNDDGDMNAIMPTHSENITIVSKNSGHTYEPNHDYMVVDAGNQTFDYPNNIAVHRIGVVRNDYLSLKGVTQSPMKHEYHNFIAYIIPSNCLTKHDVANVLRKKVVSVEMSEGVARSIDAGLFEPRWEKHFEESYQDMKVWG